MAHVLSRALFGLHLQTASRIRFMSDCFFLWLTWDSHLVLALGVQRSKVWLHRRDVLGSAPLGWHLWSVILVDVTLRDVLLLAALPLSILIWRRRNMSWLIAWAFRLRGCLKSAFVHRIDRRHLACVGITLISVSGSIRTVTLRLWCSFAVLRSLQASHLLMDAYLLPWWLLTLFNSWTWRYKPASAYGVVTVLQTISCRKASWILCVLSNRVLRLLVAHLWNACSNYFVAFVFVLA